MPLFGSGFAGLGIAIAINALGLDPQTVVTGIGLTGLALGFALRDILSNFVSGILILIMRPFELGDQIVIGDTEGSVERIELRATQIRTYDGRVILVPNAELFTSRITNNTASPVRRGSVELFLGYDVDLNGALAVIEQAAQETEGVLEDPKVSLRVRDLGQDDIVVEVRFWTDSRRSDFLATSSNVRRTAVSALRAAGIPLPDPDTRFFEFRKGKQTSSNS
jgi:small conductance mechanosensitive channel